MRIAMLWLGDFIDAKRHWNGRGQGYQPPAGESVISGPPGVPFATINDSKEPWPDSLVRKENAQLPPVKGGYIFNGYRLTGQERIPTFRYTFGALSIEDIPSPQGSFESSEFSFKRILKISGNPVKNLYFRAASGQSIELTDDDTYLIDDSTALNFKLEGKPVIREIGGKKELLIPIKFSNDSAMFEQTIRWQ